MARFTFPEAPALVKGLKPPALVRLGALVFAGIFLGFSIAVLATAWPAGALTAGQAAAAPDGAVELAGKAARVWAEGANAVTHIILAGAPTLDLRVSGNAMAEFSRGDFLVLSGNKLGDSVQVQAVRHGSDPLDLAAPYLAAGLVLATLVAVDFFTRWFSTSGEQRPGLRRLLPKLNRKSAEQPAPQAAATEPAPASR